MSLSPILGYQHIHRTQGTKKEMRLGRKQIQADLHIFLGTIGALIIIGLLFIYSSSSVYALERFHSAIYFVKKQLFGLMLGLGAIAVARLFPLSTVKRLTPLFFFGSLGLTLITMLPHFAHHIHGSSRWINIFGFSFQPSEMLKIALLLYVAHFLTKKEKRSSSFIHGYLPFLVILGVTSLVLLKQPDFGLAVTLVITTFILLFIAQFQTKHLLLTFSALLPGAIALVLFKPYRLKRILTFMNPWSDPQGAGFQIIQSLIAIGSGGMWGVGISHSKQKFFYLPMQHTDFIFSIIAEETGFAGALFLIALYAMFLYFGVRIAWQLKDPFSLFTTLGFVILISIQTIMNLAVTTGLVPTKGLGLPFVSYGLTALICNLAILGILITMVRENR